MPAFTPRTNLYKPGGGSSGAIPDEVVDVDKLNGNSDIIDASIGAPRVTSGTRPATPFDGQTIYESDTNMLMVRRSDISQWVPPGTILKVADFAALAALSTTPFVAGDLVFVIEGGIYMRRSSGGAWVQITPATFATAAERDTAYAKAAGAYRVTGVQCFVRDGRLAQNTVLTYMQDPTSGLAQWRRASGRVPINPKTTVGLSSLPDGGFSFSGVAQFEMRGCFDDSFRNYELVLDITSASVATDFPLLLGQAGTLVTSSSYSWNHLSATASAVTAGGSASAGFIQFGRTGLQGGSTRATIFAPAEAAFTRVISESIDSDNIQRRPAGSLNIASAYDTLYVGSIPTSELTGEVRLYGLVD